MKLSLKAYVCFVETIGSTLSGRGQTTISVAVSHPEVQHKVRILDFERLLESQGRTLPR
jgi:hypothetical protein